jgi:glycine/D-amino acid oxidase-like deaminating enzyme
MFGATAALALRRRGHTVTIVDPGPLPNPRAASTDISKFVRMDYGADDLYTELGAQALDGWDAWNRAFGEPLYHESGLTVMGRDPMRPGTFEYESYTRLVARGVAVERLDSTALGTRFPAWDSTKYADGYFNPRAGWAASGRVVSVLLARARSAGIAVREGVRFGHLLERGSRVAGIVAADGSEHRADVVLVAAGAWTPSLVPHLESVVWVSAQPVFHVRTGDPARLQPPRFSCWTADISRTGWYGFPALDDGTVKIANHGPGRPVDPDGSRDVEPADVERCREFLAGSFPELASAPLIEARLCLYCDSWDGNFLIDHDPDRPGLVVAAGDSGHGFKFAPVLGDIIADVVERRPNAAAERFRWRRRGELSAEDARFTGRDGNEPAPSGGS